MAQNRFFQSIAISDSYALAGLFVPILLKPRVAMVLSLSSILLIIAFICFILGALGVPARSNWVALWILVQIVGRGVR